MIVLDFPKGRLEYDSDLGFRARAHYPTPDGTLTNAFGFNDRDYPLAKTPGTFRVLVVGDSFSWAGGREGNYVNLLERKFEERYGAHKVDFINAGYPGTHTGEQLAMLRKFGLQYNPDLVILGFFVGNDFVDANPARKRIVLNDLFIDVENRKELSVMGRPLILRSRVLLFLYQKCVAFKERTVAANEGQGTVSNATYLKIERSRLEFFNVSPSRAPELQANVDYIFQSISEMDALLKSRNTKLIVAIYPDEFQVDETVLKAIFERFKLRPEDYDLDFAQNILKTFLKAKGIPFIDLLEPFRREGATRNLYLLRDTHWNGAGNQLAADRLFEELARRVGKTSD